MPKRIAALAAVLVLTLTGCAGVADDAGNERTAPSASESAAPATVDPTAPAETTEPDAEEYFLGSGFVPTIDLPDEQKIAAGYFACEQVEAGDYRVVAVEGVDAATNEAFVEAATVSLCPELADVFAEHRQY